MIVLARQFDSQLMGMFGRMFLHGGAILWTLEPSWRYNAVGRSCVPADVYTIRRGDFRGRYPNFLLESVPGRTAIEIHVGNTLLDTTGCILVGTGIGVVDDQWAVLESREAMDKLMVSMHEVDTDKLLVTDPSMGIGSSAF